MAEEEIDFLDLLLAIKPAQQQEKVAARQGENEPLRYAPIVHLEPVLELCKLYKAGKCFDEKKCIFMHGDYPCVAFNTSVCGVSPCLCSHRQPLSQIQEYIVERDTAECKLLYGVGIMPTNVKRRVLLPTPPARPTYAPIQQRHVTHASNILYPSTGSGQNRGDDQGRSRRRVDRLPLFSSPIPLRSMKFPSDELENEKPENRHDLQWSG